ncbi:unknown [[Mannheimia] succiniciproducens MBEL55E]|uniref:Uncharacterized protein n=1 Tax=Mannheimia succiniciproducens (strain KCTC 0769BP / MBEL55E) TaxID=221988 RepID=Q65UH2_MANSM|nr:unknown [[Mannheimia] succiniciproducens MBEL55E]
MNKNSHKKDRTFMYGLRYCLICTANGDSFDF